MHILLLIALGKTYLLPNFTATATGRTPACLIGLRQHATQYANDVRALVTSVLRAWGSFKGACSKDACCAGQFDV